MTALWTVLVLVAMLAAANSVVVIALTRQIALLHLRMPEPHGRQRPGAPQLGGRLWLNPAPNAFADDPSPELILLGFVRPACGGCAAALPAFTSVAAGLPGNERVLLVSDSDETGTRAYLAAHGVSLPLAAGPHLLSANGIPAVPYTVVTDGAGNVLAADAATSIEQLEAILGRARQAREAAIR